MQVAADFQRNLVAADEPNANFVDILTMLFEKIARTIDNNEPLIETHYGERIS